MIFVLHVSVSYTGKEKRACLFEEKAHLAQEKYYK